MHTPVYPVSTSALAALNDHVTRALDEHDRITLAGLSAALAALACVIPATELAKIRARAEAAVRYVTEARRHG